MTRSPVAVVSGLCLAVLMTSCAGTGQGVDTAADAAAASAAEHSSATDAGSRPAEVGSTAAQPTGGNPGVPGGDRGADAGGGSGVAQQGNPGAPGDVAVFEEAGVPYSVLRDDAATRCGGGVCTLREPKVSAGSPDDVGGVDECLITAQSDIRYDPPAEGGFFQKGATVQATVDCTVEDAGTGSTEGTQTSEAGRSGDSASATTATAVDEPPAGEPQG